MPEDSRTELETRSQAWFERDRKCSNKACLLQQDINRKKRAEYLYKRDHEKLPEALICYGFGIFHLRLRIFEPDLWTYPVECDNSPRAKSLIQFKKKRARKDGGDRDHGHTSALAAGASEYASSSPEDPDWEILSTWSQQRPDNLLASSKRAKRIFNDIRATNEEYKDPISRRFDRRPGSQTLQQGLVGADKITEEEPAAPSNDSEGILKNIT